MLLTNLCVVAAMQLIMVKLQDISLFESFWASSYYTFDW